MAGIVAGSYTDADGSIVLGWSKYMYGNSEYDGGILMSAANATIVENADGTFTFDVTFVADGTTYHFTYTTPAEEQATEGEVVLTVNKGTGAVDNYSTYIHLSDESGDNQVKFVAENTIFNEITNFPYENVFDSYKTSPDYLWGSNTFSFINKSLVVGGTTYANSDVSNASAVCTGTSLTITFTVGGAEHVFKYSM